MKRNKKKSKKILPIILGIIVIACISSIISTVINTGKIPHRFASVEEGSALMLANTEYYDNYTKNDIEFRMKKSGATLDELLSVSKESVRNFNFLEKFYIDRRIAKMYKTLKKNGYTLPDIDTITFVNTDMRLEGGASGYTHGAEIYLNSTNVMIHSLFSFIPGMNSSMDELLWHEMFHCITRNNPDFRAEMYSLINFTVADSDFEIPPCLEDKVLSNPDVEHHNSYASFTIDGTKKDCFIAWITTKDYEEGLSGWGDSEAVALIPIDGTDTYYLSNEAADFNEVFGRNTFYVIDPEECLADNFAYAMLFGLKGKNGQGYPNPEIIEGIIEIMK